MKICMNQMKYTINSIKMNDFFVQFHCSLPISLSSLTIIIILMKDKYCLQSITPFSQLNQSPTNKSTSKQTFSFCRSPRFQTISPNCPINSYSKQKLHSPTEGTAIGYGKKFDFTKSLANSPSSSKYHLKTIFDLNKDKHKGKSLAPGRDQIIFDSYINAQGLRNPGVARYNLETESELRTKKAPCFSMRQKTKVHDKTQTIQAQNHNPGPAHYQNNPQHSKTLYSSHFAKISFSTSRSKRFLNSDNKVPGPSYYQNPTSLSNVGKYLMSVHKGGTNAKFDSAARVTKFAQAEKIGMTKPGPGYYRLTSQFGNYDGDVYGRQIKLSTSRSSIKK